MNRDDVSWHGYWPAAPTPFTADGEFDEAAMRALMRCYVHDRMHGVLVNGSSGEWFSQSLDERQKVADVAVTAPAGAVPCVIGCSALLLADSIALARHAEKIGADGVMLTPPPYLRPSNDEIVYFYQRVVEMSSLLCSSTTFPAVSAFRSTSRRRCDWQHWGLSLLLRTNSRLASSSSGFLICSVKCVSLVRIS
jgi:4-hydroxy-tetrahydrodipicolinate synthase